MSHCSLLFPCKTFLLAISLLENLLVHEINYCALTHFYQSSNGFICFVKSLSVYDAEYN